MFVIELTYTIILATGHGRAAIDALMREVPFVSHGLADVPIVEFPASPGCARPMVRAALASSLAR